MLCNCGGVYLSARGACGVSIFFMSLSKPCTDERYNEWALARVLLYTFRTEDNQLRELEAEPDQLCLRYDSHWDEGGVFFHKLREFEHAPTKTVCIWIDQATLHIKVRITHETKWDLMELEEYTLDMTIEPVPGPVPGGRFVGPAPWQFPTFESLREWIRGLNDFWYAMEEA